MVKNMAFSEAIEKVKKHLVLIELTHGKRSDLAKALRMLVDVARLEEARREGRKHA